MAQTVLDGVRVQAGSDFIHEALMGECVLEAMGERSHAVHNGPATTLFSTR
jgi:hypothetical protein